MTSYFVLFLFMSAALLEVNGGDEPPYALPRAPKGYFHCTANRCCPIDRVCCYMSTRCCDDSYMVPLNYSHHCDGNAFTRHVGNLKSHNTGSEYIKDYGCVQYTAELGMGTPKQMMKVVMDTGLSNLWMSSARFDSKKSSTFMHKSGCRVTRSLTSGTMEGVNVHDVMMIGGSMVRDQSFEMMRSGPSSRYFDGMFGLSYPNTHQGCDQEINPLQNMHRQHSVPMMFGIWMNRNQAGGVAGEVAIGGMDTKYVDEKSLHYIPVSMKSKWQISMDSVRVSSGQMMCEGGCHAMIDSSTPIIGGPTHVVKKMYDNMNVRTTEVNGVHEVNCQDMNKMPTLIFIMNGKNYQLRPQEYVMKMKNGGSMTCMSSLVGIDLPENHWVLGNTFLMNFYTVFDQENDRVGFGDMRMKLQGEDY